MGGPFALFLRHIRGRGTQTEARIEVDPIANATYWGAKKRTGWNRRNRNSAPQHPEWVGASWTPAVAGQGPYAINDALARHRDEILDMFGEAVDRTAARAFPDP